MSWLAMLSFAVSDIYTASLKEFKIVGSTKSARVE